MFGRSGFQLTDSTPIFIFATGAVFWRNERNGRNLQIYIGPLSKCWSSHRRCRIAFDSSPKTDYFLEWNNKTWLDFSWISHSKWQPMAILFLLFLCNSNYESACFLFMNLICEQDLLLFYQRDHSKCSSVAGEQSWIAKYGAFKGDSYMNGMEL